MEEGLLIKAQPAQIVWIAYQRAKTPQKTSC